MDAGEGDLVADDVAVVVVAAAASTCYCCCSSFGIGRVLVLRFFSLSSVETFRIPFPICFFFLIE